MAQWVNRARTDGGASIQIKWRLAGRWQSETFTDARAAAEFRAAVEACGHCWPQGWIKGAGWTPPEPEPVMVTVGDVALGQGGYFAEQDKGTGSQARSRECWNPGSSTGGSTRSRRPCSGGAPTCASCFR